VNVGFARVEGHGEVEEIVPTAHAVKRFRERYPIRTAGIDAVAGALIEALERADVSGWPPAWAVSNRPAELWAVVDDCAFPLARTGRRGRWTAITCLRR
jgi:hypothetical protein